jgi:hypothetical protein
MSMAAMTGTHKRATNGLQQPSEPSDYANGTSSTTTSSAGISRTKKNKNKNKKTNNNNSTAKERISLHSSSSSGTRTTFTVLCVGCVAVLGVIQWTLNVVLFQAMDQHNDEASSLSKPSLAAQIATLERQLYQWQQQTQLYSDDGNFYPFSIRDSRRLVPTQLPPGFHVWDYVDINTQNQQRTKRAALFHNAKQQAPAPCQKYDLLCYKSKIIQVFELVLQQNPTTEYFFYMEADNELCSTLTEIRRLAYEYQRYFITTGIGFSGWIMQRAFMLDFVQLLKDFVPPIPKDRNDILSQQGPHPSEGPDPIAAEYLIDHQSWTVTRQYLVSHSIQPGLGVDALTVRMPVANNNANIAHNVSAVESAALAASDAKKNKGLDKHLPRCWEPRRSKWRISKKDHRDRFGWDYFDYDECDGEVFPCYVGQLEDLLAQDMAEFNYTQLDLDRQKLIEKQQERQRKKLLKEKGLLPEGDGDGDGGSFGGVPGAVPLSGAAGAAIAMQQQQQRLVQAALQSHEIHRHISVNGLKNDRTELQERLKILTENARIRHEERLKAQNEGGFLRGGAAAAAL